MGDMFPVTIDEQIACIERELKLRRDNYPRWVAAKRMSRRSADQELRRMGAVLDSLRQLKDMGAK